MRHRRLLAAGAALDLLAVLACLVLPLYSTSDGSRADGSATLLAVNGPGALVPLGLFLGLGLLAWCAPWWGVRLAAVALHGVLTVLALLTIGVLFVPAALVLAVGGVLDLVRALVPRTPTPPVPA